MKVHFPEETFNASTQQENTVVSEPYTPSDAHRATPKLFRAIGSVLSQEAKKTLNVGFKFKSSQKKDGSIELIITAIIRDERS